MNTTNKAVYLDAAYQFFKAAYSTIKLDKEEFWQQIAKAPQKFNIVELAYNSHGKDEVILQTRFGGWEDLKSILHECTSLLDKDFESVAEYRRGQNIFQLDIVTAAYHIIIRRDWVEQYDVIKITHR